MLRVVLEKDGDRVTISSKDGTYYSLTCSYHGHIYLRDRQPDVNYEWAAFQVKSYLKMGYAHTEFKATWGLIFN